ncbi:hypothetical protein SK128_011893 [Halocaridina rubra]|uniref:Uncharacterized protein n=1 Tax=Halocaridina rubra TaxID=373956 RepID=A0AAN8ZXR1_HALRR
MQCCATKILITRCDVESITEPRSVTNFDASHLDQSESGAVLRSGRHLQTEHHIVTMQCCATKILITRCGDVESITEPRSVTNFDASHLD